MLPEAFLFDVGSKVPFHDTAGGFVTSVTVHCTEQRFEGTGQDGGFVPAAAALFTFAQVKQWTKIEQGSLFRKHRGIHQRRAHSGQVTLALLRKTANQKITDGKIQDRIAEKLQHLVVPGAPFSVMGYMGQSTNEQRSIRERVSQLLLQPRLLCVFNQASLR